MSIVLFGQAVTTAVPRMSASGSCGLPDTPDVTRWAADTLKELVMYEGEGDNGAARGVDRLNMDSAAPVQTGPDGVYPTCQPGFLKDHEH